MRIRLFSHIAAFAMAFGLSAGLASADNFSFTGTFLTDDEMPSFTVTIAAASTVVIRTWGYAGGVNAAGQTIPRGGLDPYIALFDSNGVLIAQNDDGAGFVATDPNTGAAKDSYLTEGALPAGTYTVVLTEHDNFANGPNLANGFHEQNNGDFTAMYGCTNGKFCDDTFVNPYNNRTGFWALDIDGVISAVANNADEFQISYAANVKSGGSFIDITNAGVLGGTDPVGDICANVYVFDPGQELLECCACLLTPQHLMSLDVLKDLASNSLTPGGVPTSVTVALFASAASSTGGAPCNASTVLKRDGASGMRAWSTTTHQIPGGKFQTEVPFLPADLSASEFTKLTSTCSFIQSNGSSYGICKSCQVGALGAAKQ